MAICGKRSFSCCPLSHCARVRPLTAVAFEDTGDLSGVVSGDSLQCGVAERQMAFSGLIWNELDGYMLVTNGPPPALNSPPPGQLTGEANTTEAL
ncbi:hypothetical protein HaLaN_17467 [Haematococcus lacustris]|uniref:Uncharacterized protein n=1 Tax=Haematococcus lacustris TaxID=44745 RepID=A0A699ZPH8_HAELA|nr:hypothetical protein HaLaN_17467 [Haematococcus lacustris]